MIFGARDVREPEPGRPLSWSVHSGYAMGNRCRPSWTSRSPDPEGRESATSFPSWLCIHVLPASVVPPSEGDSSTGGERFGLTTSWIAVSSLRVEGEPIHRLRKRRKSAPNHSKTRLNLGQSQNRMPPEGRPLVSSFQDRQEFWRGTAVRETKCPLRCADGYRR